MADNNERQAKNNSILSDREALMRTLERMQKKHNLCMKYLDAHNATNDKSNMMHDSRNLKGLALMQIDVDNIPEEEWERHYDREIGKMVVDFNTPDPATGLPYPEMVKPYIKNFYDNLTTSEMVTDWSDEKQIEKFLCTLILNQAQATVLKDFTKECIELYPTSRERELLDAKCGQVNADYYAADRKIQEYRIKFKNYIPLHPCNGNAINTYIEEFVTKSLNEGVVKDNNVVTLNYGSMDLMDKFIKGKVIAEREDLSLGIEAADEPMWSDYTNSDFNRAFVDVLVNASVVMPFERLVLSPLGTSKEAKFSSGELLLINGKPISKIMSERGEEFVSNPDSAAELIRSALTDGSSVVEIMRVGFENDGKATFRHQELKVDLDKLNSDSRKENHNIFRRMLHNIGIWKIPDRYPSNSQRDNAQNALRENDEFRENSILSEKNVIDKYNSIVPLPKLKANSFEKNYSKLEYVSDMKSPKNEREFIFGGENEAGKEGVINEKDVNRFVLGDEDEIAIPDEPVEIKAEPKRGEPQKKEGSIDPLARIGYRPKIDIESLRKEGLKLKKMRQSILSGNRSSDAERAVVEVNYRRNLEVYVDLTNFGAESINRILAEKEERFAREDAGLRERFPSYDPLPENDLKEEKNAERVNVQIDLGENKAIEQSKRIEGGNAQIDPPSINK